MCQTKRFSIGEVAKLFHISVSSLRHYEELGLLVPEQVNPHSGYRYYSTRQFEVLNTIRYLRALDLPLHEISEFLQNRDVDVIEKTLERQRDAVIDKQRELERIRRKIDNRLRQIRDAKTSKYDTVKLEEKEACRVVFLKDALEIKESSDMEAPIRRLEQEQTDALIFLGKVGVSISKEHLQKHHYASYDGIFLLLDREDRFRGKTLFLPKTLCVSIRFRGSHAQAPEQYETLAAYCREHRLIYQGFSREITMIDYGMTNDPEKFVTEISIPVERE